ncbi:MAG: membrane carboxypeptidase [Rhodospirillaceae bacterium]|nr:MAG: membrane carboxypeptidase [Rhodospirillaceae bacterium]
MTDRTTKGLRADPADAPVQRRHPRPRPPSKPPSKKPTPSSRKRGPRSKRWIWRFVGWSATLVIWGGIVVLGVVAWYATDLPDVQSAAALQRRPAVTVLAADGETIAGFGDLYGDPVQLKDLPPYVPQAVLAIEDRRFYSHFGIDPLGILRAAITNFQAGRVAQGGSTITQQVAKNLFLSPERHFKRKIQEVLLSLWLERTFSKEQILSLYLNRVYLGSGVYGINAAAHRYFGRSAWELTLYQAAMLAGLPKAPSRYNPATNPEAADGRARQVLAAMVDAQFLEPQQAKTVEGGAMTALLGGMVPTGRYFSDWILSEVSTLIAPIDRDLTVHTTLDRALQIGVENALETMLATPTAVKAHAGQGAVAVLTHQGAVRALVGGREYGDSQFNRATQGLRQPGSAFKPFVFLAGLESGLAPESVIEDAPLRIGQWRPKNFSGRFEGPVTLSHALAHSINTVAVRVAERAGLSRVTDVGKRLGLPMPAKPDATLALGTSEVTLLNLTAAYATLASGGRKAVPFGITEIRDREGQVLYRRPRGDGSPVVQPGVAAALIRLMTGVLTEGTGRKASLDRPAAGKTGTTQEFRDAWFVGFTADYVAGVWMGNDDNTPMKKEMTGGNLPALLWREAMLLAHRSRPARPLPGADGPMVPMVVETTPAPAVKVKVKVKVKEEGGLDGLIHSLFGG